MITQRLMYIMQLRVLLFGVTDSPVQNKNDYCLFQSPISVALIIIRPIQKHSKTYKY